MSKSIWPSNKRKRIPGRGSVLWLALLLLTALNFIFCPTVMASKTEVPAYLTGSEQHQEKIDKVVDEEAAREGAAQTGDERGILLPIALCGAALAVWVFFVVERIRNRKRE